MNVTVFPEKDLPNGLLEKGDYDVEVLEATDEVSKKSGNDMIKLTLAVWVGDKVRCRIFDYLLDALPAKLRHASDTFGLLSKYESGSLRAMDFVGRTGRAKIVIEEDKSNKYPPKNKILDYVCRQTKQLNSNPPAPDIDDLPF
jgi:hypothetical protein